MPSTPSRIKQFWLKCTAPGFRLKSPLEYFIIYKHNLSSKTRYGDEYIPISRWARTHFFYWKFSGKLEEIKVLQIFEMCLGTSTRMNSCSSPFPLSSTVDQNSPYISFNFWGKSSKSHQLLTESKFHSTSHKKEREFCFCSTFNNKKHHCESSFILKRCKPNFLVEIKHVCFYLNMKVARQIVPFNLLNHSSTLDTEFS